LWSALPVLLVLRLPVLRLSVLASRRPRRCGPADTTATGSNREASQRNPSVTPPASETPILHPSIGVDAVFSCRSRAEHACAEVRHATCIGPAQERRSKPLGNFLQPSMSQVGALIR